MSSACTREFPWPQADSNLWKTGDCPEAPLPLSSGSPLSRHHQWMPLHAQIALPATVHRTAAIAADRDKHAQKTIDKPARYAGRGALAVGTCACDGGITALVSMTATCCIQCIHGLCYYLSDGDAVISSALSTLTRRHAQRQAERWGQASLLRSSKSLICFSASSFVMP